MGIVQPKVNINNQIKPLLLEKQTYCGNGVGWERNLDAALLFQIQTREIFKQMMMHFPRH